MLVVLNLYTSRARQAGAKLLIMHRAMHNSRLMAWPGSMSYADYQPRMPILAQCAALNQICQLRPHRLDSSTDAQHSIC